MPRRFLTAVLLCLLLAWATAAFADHVPTTLDFPRWTVSTSEEAWANNHLPGGRKRYPIANLFDRSLRTAWVFEGPKWDAMKIMGEPPVYTAAGGVGHWVELTWTGPGEVTVDAIGLVNGYAKSPALYARNNRIIRLRVERGYAEQPRVIATATLPETGRLQIIPIRSTRIGTIRVRVQRVATGRDNDLCLSELQLYHHGRPLVGLPPAYMMYDPGDECGCGDEGHLVDRGGHLIGNSYDCPEYAFSPDGTAVAVGHGEEATTITIIDLHRGARLCERRVSDSGYLDELRWEGNRRVRYTVKTGDGQVLRRGVVRPPSRRGRG